MSRKVEPAPVLVRQQQQHPNGNQSVTYRWINTHVGKVHQQLTWMTETPKENKANDNAHDTH